jgi:hypothetical protein
MNLTRKEYTDPAEKKKDFRIGIALFFGLNILLALCSWGLTALLFSSTLAFDSSNTQAYNIYSVLSCVIGALPLVINIGLILYFAFTRSQIALGMVTGFGIALLITICLGVIFTAYCFYALSSGGQ